jgi:hypothetical protein
MWTWPHPPKSDKKSDNAATRPVVPKNERTISDVVCAEISKERLDAGGGASPT